MSPCPWHDRQWKSLVKRALAGQFPHATLLYGFRGTGVSSFGDSLAKMLLCQGTGDMPCHQCRSCKLLVHENHPDFLPVTLAGDSAEIKVGQVREIKEFLMIRGSLSTAKVVLLSAADKMNKAASASLLKILEEPPANSFLVLSCHSPFALAATIRSRCQLVRLASPTPEETIEWLVAQTRKNVEVIKTALRVSENKATVALKILLARQQKGLGMMDFEEGFLQWLKGERSLGNILKTFKEVPAPELQQWLLTILQNKIREVFTNNGHEANAVFRLFQLYDSQLRRMESASRLNPMLLLESALLEFKKPFLNVMSR